MYESHFGFSQSPFQITPDPAFLYSSKGHRRAASYLQYGLHKGEGFIVITGEIGAGKTTLVRSLLDSLDDQAIVAAHIESTQLTPEQLLREIGAKFGLPVQGQDKSGLLGMLRDYLSQLHASEQRALLMIDEAQNLSVESLEELRLLSNYTIESRAPLQAFLVGQPELRETMAQPQLNQFRQRTVASYHLGPLDAEEAAEYVTHRLRHAGWTGHPEIADGVMACVHAHTGGIPRRINALFDQVLTAACLDESDEISVELVDSTAHESGFADSGVSPGNVAGAVGAVQNGLPAGLAGTLAETQALAAVVRGGSLTGQAPSAQVLQDIDMRISALEASNVLVVQTLRRLLGEIERMSGGVPGNSTRQ